MFPQRRADRLLGRPRRSAPTTSQPGGIATVFPGSGRDADGYDGVTSPARPRCSSGCVRARRSRRRKGQAAITAGRPRHWGFVAFSKICTHAGCPASLYEQQTSRLLCPCHQSQFEVLEDAKPVFGPATRSLPKLPLGVEIVQTAASTSWPVSDFHEPIGPGFWERK